MNTATKNILDYAVEAYRPSIYDHEPTNLDDRQRRYVDAALVDIATDISVSDTARTFTCKNGQFVLQHNGTLHYYKKVVLREFFSPNQKPCGYAVEGKAK